MPTFDAFSTGDYLSLETLKKSGEAVATPVWYAKVGERIYVYSLADAWKVKRVRNNPAVRIAPCSIGGTVHGEWLAAHARIVEHAAAAEGHAARDRKYFMKRIARLWSRLLGRRHAMILITPP